MKINKCPGHPLFSFFLALICWIIFLAAYQVLGFGNYTLLRGDLHAQYIDFISMFLRVLRGEESFWYSFSIYLGSGSVLTHAYYCLSPFNLLYLIDFVSIPVMTTVIIGLKFALAAATFTFFCRKVLNRSDLYVTLFSLCYAFNAFSITFYFNIIWLDALYMLPVLTWLLFELMDNGRYLALTICWFYLFVTNFYMAYTLGIYAFLVFVALLIYRAPANRTAYPKQCLHRSFLFFLAPVLAAGMAAVILLPSALFIFSHMANDNFEFEELKCSVFDIINAMFIGIMPHCDNETPLLYCGLPTLLLLPFYFGCKRFSERERILSLLLLLFFVVGTFYLPLFVALHAFDFPNWYGFRFSYIMIFLMCICSLRATEDLSAISPRKILLYIIGLLFFFSFMTKFWPLYTRRIDITSGSLEFAVNILFLFLWYLLLFHPPVRNVQTKHRIIGALLVLVCMIAELVVNAKICMDHTGMTPLGESEFNQWYYSEKSAVEQLKQKDPSFYRISVVNEASSNAPSLFGYAGLNTFSTSDVYELRSALHSLGICAVNRAIMEFGYTPVTMMLLGCKYSVRTTTFDEVDHSVTKDNYVPAVTDTNNYALPLGYMVKDDIYDYAPGDDPFSNQEQLLELMTGNKYTIYEHLTQDDLEISASNMSMTHFNDWYAFTRETHLFPSAFTIFSAQTEIDEDFFVCFSRPVAEALGSSTKIVGETTGLLETPLLSYGCIHQGTMLSDQRLTGYSSVSIYFPDNTYTSDHCNGLSFAKSNKQSVAPVFEDLNSSVFHITDFRNDRICGTVTADNEKNTLFLSIPWEKGWTAQIDGTLAELRPALDNAFLSLEVSPGTHEVSLQYTAPGSRTGMRISIVFAIIVVVLLTWQTLRAKHRK